MLNMYRLNSDELFKRSEETETPYNVVFLSVEGNETEVNYFEHLNVYRKELGLRAIINIEVLHRSSRDTKSGLASVVDLLDEAREIKNIASWEDVLDKEFKKLIPNKYNIDEFMEAYFCEKESITSKEKELIDSYCYNNKIDIKYIDRIRKIGGYDDIYAIVVDRDKQNHKVKQMEDIKERCERQGYIFYLTNPCFELWLLLHFLDADEVDKDVCLKNRKMSNRKTYVGKELSNFVPHGKGISEEIFEFYYLPKIRFALENARKLSTEWSELIENIGSNLPDLFDLILEKV